MTPAVAGLFASGLAASYVPFLRVQIREGEIKVPAGGIAPLCVCRDDYPLAFRLCATAMVLFTAGLIVIGLGLVAEAFR